MVKIRVFKLSPFHHHHIPIKLTPHYGMLTIPRRFNYSLMHEIIDFLSRDSSILVCISTSSQATFQKYRKQAVLETCLSWSF